MLALASHDLRTANAVLDPAVHPWWRTSPAPLHQFGLWALLRTATDDRGAEARLALEGVPVSRRRANAAALWYAEAVAAGRAGRADDAAAALLEGRSWARRRRGCAGCCARWPSTAP